ncbi:MAG TPA: hypothetical protein VD932_03755 [Aquabacterium sp.]|nr:hypothetical protein [Aquabacterium sp.]
MAELCGHCGDPREGDEEDQCYDVSCARCSAEGCCASMICEEGDEWECPPCNERENAREDQQSSGDRYQEEMRAEHDSEMRRDAFGLP